MKRFRLWLADRCIDIGTRFYLLADKIDPGPMGEVCPDCGVPTVRDADDNCPECVDRWEQKQRDEALMAGAYDDGYEAGRHSLRCEGDW